MSKPPIFERILLTGAAGGLGRQLRVRLAPYAKTLRLSDIADIDEAGCAQEEIVTCDLADKQAVYRLVEGVDAIVHFGGVSTEHAFEDILGPNICGTFHIYEAARRHGVRRLVFASSNHVVGFHRRTEKLDASCARLPDSYYGLSKSYGEDLATFYWHRYGIETVSLRIGSSFDAPENVRMLSTWLSYRDLTQLVVKGLSVPGVGHTVVFGASDNPDTWWDNRLAAHLHYEPVDSSAVFAETVRRQSLGKPDPGAAYQGGGFTEAGPF